jgi:hypothetical protein
MVFCQIRSRDHRVPHDRQALSSGDREPRSLDASPLGLHCFAQAWIIFSLVSQRSRLCTQWRKPITTSFEKKIRSDTASKLSVEKTNQICQDREAKERAIFLVLLIRECSHGPAKERKEKYDSELLNMKCWSTAFRSVCLFRIAFDRGFVQKTERSRSILI